MSSSEKKSKSPPYIKNGLFGYCQVWLVKAYKGQRKKIGEKLIWHLVSTLVNESVGSFQNLPEFLLYFIVMLRSLASCLQNSTEQETTTPYPQTTEEWVCITYTALQVRVSAAPGIVALANAGCLRQVNADQHTHTCRRLGADSRDHEKGKKGLA